MIDESLVAKPKIEKKPKWIRVKLPTGKKYTELRSLVDKYKLNTICSSGSCPNMGECWGEGTATFMILGNICTRSCGFCGVKTGRPESVDWEEPEKVANSIKIMKIKHAVLTSVDRDDLRDMGTLIWTETVKSIRRISPETTLETLIPDFQGIEKHLDKIVDVNPEVVSHNMETVRRLTREVRIQAKYDRSLKVLHYLKENGIYTTFRYYPLHWVDFYQNKESLPNTEYAANHTLCLPIHQNLTNKEVNYIINTIKNGKNIIYNT